MVQFGAILEESKVSFDETFRDHFVDYEELKRVLDRPGVTSFAFERALDTEIEKSALFACGRVGHVAEVLREGGDVAAARTAMSLLLATLRFVELNLIAIRKIVKKRDKFEARGGFAVSDRHSSGASRPGTRKSRSNWLLCPERSRHLECLESFEPQFAALLVSARAIRESRAFGATRGPPTLNVAKLTPKTDDSRARAPGNAPPRPGSALDRKNTNSMMGTLIATGDAADARALAELIESCEHALASAHAARTDLRHHASAMHALGVDADDDYAKTLSRQTEVPQHHLRHLARGNGIAIFDSPSHSRECNGSRFAPLELRDNASYHDRRKHHTFLERCCLRLVASADSMCGARGNSSLSTRWWLHHKDEYSRAPLDGEIGVEDVDEEVVAAIAARRIALAAQCSGAALYSASCYAIAPTVHDYTAFVRAPEVLAGLLLAAAPLASLASRYAMSEWCRRANIGFKPPVILGGALCCAGNLLYCVAPRLVRVRHQWPLALFARVAVGASGGADAVNRRYIGTADLPPSDRGAAAARYVASDALGVALGPLLAAVCAEAVAVSRRHRKGPANLTVLTMPSLVLAAAWALHALFVAVLWHENKSPADPNPAAMSPPLTHDSVFSSASGSCASPYEAHHPAHAIENQAEANSYEPHAVPKLASAPPLPVQPSAPSVASSALQAAPAQHEHPTTPQYGAVAIAEDDDSSVVDRPVTRATSMDIVLSPTAFPFYSALGRLFASGVVHEVLLASSALVSDYKFRWSPRLSGTMLCGLRLTALVSTRQADDFAERLDERALSLAASAGTLLATLLLVSWPFHAERVTLAVWLVASFVAFSCAEVMAVAERALVAKLAASSARKRCPLIAIGARVCGDLIFALAATRRSLSGIMFVLWLPPSLALIAALASALFAVDRAYRATEQL
mmetsp:Transcript_16264/g.51003  ORF Transcript_16264/g.51003 Transcript_16264/m.51003 type:complete len:917 (+) Transcript_16264:208-2958(+)